ncbi:MAG: stage sporulation protein [Eubacteriales bacterium]|nr:stage sporulation protein [Eubacteriales bacterium]MDN5363083.1 stage sporulation protein [Eubacteriales bacterium]
MVAKLVRPALSALVNSFTSKSVKILLSISGLVYSAGWIVGFLSCKLFLPPEGPIVPIHNSGVIQILVHNLRAGAPILAGVATFGFTTFFFLIMNGIVAGFAAASAQKVMGWEQVCLRILPHGLFEIPATVAWGAAGFSSVWWVLTRMFDIGVEEKFWHHVLVLIAAGGILLAIAAVIEGAITYRFALNS